MPPTGLVAEIDGETMPTLTQTLSRYGISGRDTKNVEPRRDGQGVWRIKFSAPGDPTGVLVGCEDALRLADALRFLSDAALADRIVTAVAKAKRFTRSPL